MDGAVPEAHTFDLADGADGVSALFKANDRRRAAAATVEAEPGR